MHPNDPRHGTYRGFHAHKVAGTEPCDPCRVAHYRYNKEYRVEVERTGRPRRINTAPVVEHVAALRESGMPTEEIARIAGVAPGTVLAAVPTSSRYNTTMRAATAERILAVKPTAKVAAGYVDALGPARRLQALVAIGYSARHLGERLGTQQQNVSRLMHSHQKWLQVATRDRIVAVYNELHMTPGPSTRARTIAKKHGWLPPLAWNNVDDPHEKPRTGDRATNNGHVDPAIVERLLAGEKVPSTPAEKGEALRRWTASGNSAKSLADRHGWKAERYYRQENAA